MRIIVVGDGIAANLLVNQLNLNSPIDVVKIASSAVPVASTNSTATLALRNIQEGLSPLGDIIYRSYFYTEQFLEANELDGVEKTQHLECWGEDYEKKESKIARYPESHLISSELLDEKVVGDVEDCYVFSPEKFLKALKEKQKNIKVIDDFIRGIESDGVVGLQKKYRADAIVWATGAYIKEFNYFFKFQEIEKTKMVRGSYLEFDADYEKAFSLCYDGINLVYRRGEKKLLLGNTTFNGGIAASEFEELKSSYHKLNSILSRKLPDLNEGTWKTALRHKGRRRMPWWGQIGDTKHYAITGLYKNGYSFSFLAAYELAKKLMSDVVKS
ncbi:MAG: FAD-binding oxidoreductase [Halobacteriovoraceae bacterium]|nr:FAD-binding oxidoreductase [Halobacteriovoraceae bacterium]